MGADGLREVVLVGGGHAHLEVLRRFGMDPPPDARVTLVARETEAVYSGMLPGTLAGRYEPDEGRIDLRPLARFAGARLLHAEAVGLDPERRVLELRGRPSLPYDLLSLDVGSAPATGGVPGAAERATVVKPIDRFLERWRRTEARGVEAEAGPHVGPPLRVAVVGGGAGGVEIALALERRLRGRGRAARLLLVTASDDVLPGRARSARRRLRRILAERDVEVRTGARVVEVDEGGLRLEDGSRVAAHEVVWVTAASAPSWPGAAGLATDEEGFVLVDDALRSVSHPEVFAAGDVATMRRHPRPKAGVIAVRQGPPLAGNLRRALAGRGPRPFRPQRTFLSILATGDGRAVATRGPFAVEGRWVRRLKDRIDRRWVRKYVELPAMEEDGGSGGARGMAAPGARRAGAGARGSAMPPMRCAGCGGKVGGRVLAGVLDELAAETDGRDAPSGRGTALRTRDDGAVVRLPDGRVQVQSLDFFRDPLGDPWLLGRMAALHALADLHAMGAAPATALALVTLPHLPDRAAASDLRQVLGGASAVLADEGAALIGGHTSEGDALAAGFAVTGTAAGAALTPGSGLRPGDALVLTEPLGTGVVLAAEMRGRARSAWVDEALEAMLRSCGPSGEVLRAHGARGVTDVTGFGLAGHLLEMLRASDVGACVRLEALPLLEGAERAAALGVRSTLHAANVETAPDLAWDGAAASDDRAFAVHDPQTSGGLLAGVPAEAAEACVRALAEAGYARAAVIGTVTAYREGAGSPTARLRIRGGS